MIRKSNKNLLNWIYEYIIDFTDEKDVSGLTWTSTHDEALKFLHSIPQKERVQRYGFYSSHSIFFLVDSLDEIIEVLKNGFISQRTCNIIYNWNLEVGRENWDMDDVMYALYPALGRHISRNFFYATIKNLVDLGVMECVNPETEHGRMYIITEKGERVLGLL